jgi:hypothetical protein
MRVPLVGSAAACVVLCVMSAAHAQTPSGRLARPTVTVPRATPAPVIDGKLDDETWRSAARLSQFVQQTPVEGAPASENTDVFVAYDSTKVYFGIHAHYSNPSLVRANRTDRDQTSNDDTVTVFFDPFLDQQRGYAFSVNGYGVQRDWVLPPAGPGGGQSSSGDATWNALYTTAAVLVEDGWTAEMAIPIKSLRYPTRGASEMHRWGFQVQREIRGKDEIVSWVPVSTKVLGFMPQMGVMEGLQNLSTARNLEIMPTVTAVQVGKMSPAGAFLNDDVEEGGLNLKYGLTSNLTLDFTYNPDFSQIESDRPQIEVNQRFPLLFAELRPFFLEGKEIYQIAGPITYLHTRTILDPRFGAKITGKIGKSQIGILFADDEAPGRVDNPLDPAFGRSAQAFIGRLKQDIYRESHIGVMYADREFMQSYSRIAFVDGGLRLGRSARYAFQIALSDRRDMSGVRHTGPVLNMDFRKDGRNLTYFGAHNEVHPDYGNDLGFIRRVDQKQTVGSIGYKWWPKRYLVNWGPGARYDVLYDWNGVKTDDKRNASVAFQFVNNISVTANVDQVMERFRDINFHKVRYSLSGTVNTNRKILLTAGVNAGDEIRFIVNPYLGDTTAYNATVTLRPSSRFQSEVALNTTHFTDVRTNTTDFDVKIIRALTTYQFTERLLIRNILETNTLSKTVGLNLLGTYRVNAGTVFFVGYDDRYREGSQINARIFTTDAYERTNRALFAKLQYLFRR